MKQRMIAWLQEAQSFFATLDALCLERLNNNRNFQAKIQKLKRDGKSPALAVWPVLNEFLGNSRNLAGYRQLLASMPAELKTTYSEFAVNPNAVNASLAIANFVAPQFVSACCQVAPAAFSSQRYSEKELEAARVEISFVQLSALAVGSYVEENIPAFNKLVLTLFSGETTDNQTRLYNKLVQDRFIAATVQKLLILHDQIDLAFDAIKTQLCATSFNNWFYDIAVLDWELVAFKKRALLPVEGVTPSAHVLTAEFFAIMQWAMPWIKAALPAVVYTSVTEVLETQRKTLPKISYTEVSLHDLSALTRAASKEDKLAAEQTCYDAKFATAEALFGHCAAEGSARWVARLTDLLQHKFFSSTHREKLLAHFNAALDPSNPLNKILLQPDVLRLALETLDASSVLDGVIANAAHFLSFIDGALGEARLAALHAKLEDTDAWPRYTKFLCDQLIENLLTPAKLLRSSILRQTLASLPNSGFAILGLQLLQSENRDALDQYLGQSPQESIAALELLQRRCTAESQRSQFQKAIYTLCLEADEPTGQPGKRPIWVEAFIQPNVRAAVLPWLTQEQQADFHETVLRRDIEYHFSSAKRLQQYLQNDALKNLKLLRHRAKQYPQLAALLAQKIVPYLNAAMIWQQKLVDELPENVVPALLNVEILGWIEFRYFSYAAIQPLLESCIERLSHSLPLLKTAALKSKLQDLWQFFKNEAESGAVFKAQLKACFATAFTKDGPSSAWDPALLLQLQGTVFTDPVEWLAFLEPVTDYIKRLPTELAQLAEAQRLTALTALKPWCAIEALQTEFNASAYPLCKASVVSAIARTEAANNLWPSTKAQRYIYSEVLTTEDKAAVFTDALAAFKDREAFTDFFGADLVGLQVLESYPGNPINKRLISYSEDVFARQFNSDYKTGGLVVPALDARLAKYSNRPLKEAFAVEWLQVHFKNTTTVTAFLSIDRDALSPKERLFLLCDRFGISNNFSALLNVKKETKVGKRSSLLLDANAVALLLETVIAWSEEPFGIREKAFIEQAASVVNPLELIARPEQYPAAHAYYLATILQNAASLEQFLVHEGQNEVVNQLEALIACCQTPETLEVRLQQTLLKYFMAAKSDSVLRRPKVMNCLLRHYSNKALLGVFQQCSEVTGPNIEAKVLVCYDYSLMDSRCLAALAELPHLPGAVVTKGKFEGLIEKQLVIIEDQLLRCIPGLQANNNLKKLPQVKNILAWQQQQKKTLAGRIAALAKIQTGLDELAPLSPTLNERLAFIAEAIKELQLTWQRQQTPLPRPTVLSVPVTLADFKAAIALSASEKLVACLSTLNQRLYVGSVYTKLCKHLASRADFTTLFAGSTVVQGLVKPYYLESIKKELGESFDLAKMTGLLETLVMSPQSPKFIATRDFLCEKLAVLLATEVARVKAGADSSVLLRALQVINQPSLQEKLPVNQQSAAIAKDLLAPDAIAVFLASHTAGPTRQKRLQVLDYITDTQDLATAQQSIKEHLETKWQEDYQGALAQITDYHNAAWWTMSYDRKAECALLRQRIASIQALPLDVFLKTRLLREALQQAEVHASTADTEVNSHQNLYRLMVGERGPSRFQATLHEAITAIPADEASLAASVVAPLPSETWNELYTSIATAVDAYHQEHAGIFVTTRATELKQWLEFLNEAKLLDAEKVQALWEKVHNLTLKAVAKDATGKWFSSQHYSPLRDLLVKVQQELYRVAANSLSTDAAVKQAMCLQTMLAALKVNAANYSELLALLPESAAGLNVSCISILTTTATAIEDNPKASIAKRDIAKMLREITTLATIVTTPVVSTTLASSQSGRASPVESVTGPVTPMRGILTANSNGSPQTSFYFPNGAYHTYTNSMTDSMMGSVTPPSSRCEGGMPTLLASPAISRSTSLHAGGLVVNDVPAHQTSTSLISLTSTG